jgi:hypothetical protein
MHTHSDRYTAWPLFEVARSRGWKGMYIRSVTSSVGLPVGISADTKCMFSRLGWTMHTHSDRCTAWPLVEVARSRGCAGRRGGGVMSRLSLLMGRNVDTGSVSARLGWTMHAHSDRCTAWPQIRVASSRGWEGMYIHSVTSSVGLPVGISADTKSMFSRLGWTMHSHSGCFTAWPQIRVARSQGWEGVYRGSIIGRSALPTG